jgi:nucleoside-diphosphate-sugar epimerase
MHIFVTGGSGLTGPAVVSELIGAGHTVTGLARSDASAAKLQALGATPHRGSLEDLDALRAGAATADGVLHMGFGGDFADPDDLIRRDRNAIEALGEPLGEGAPFAMTSGTFAMRAGSVSKENDAPDEGSIAYFRIPGEQACLDFAQQGVRSSVVRLAPTVHGPGDYGFIAMLIAAARRTGVSAYVGDGANRWPAIHRADAATLFRLALEKAPAGGVAFHGADESAITLRTIADAIGRTLEIPTKSLTPEQAAEHFHAPFMAIAYAADAPASNTQTRELLGWEPAHPTLLEDLRTGDYFQVPVASS